jgi:hypothetical protein
MATLAGPLPMASAATDFTLAQSTVYDVCQSKEGAFPLSSSCDLSGVVYGYLPDGSAFVDGTWQSVSTSHTGFRLDGGRVGLVDVQLHQTVDGAAHRSTDAGATVVYSFEIGSRPGAADAPDSVPVLFNSQGEGHVVTAGPQSVGILWIRTYVARDADLFPLSGHDNPPYQLNIGGANGQRADGEFNETVALDLRPATRYWVVLEADCRLNDGSGSDCWVNADPGLTFDQARFDAEHPGTSISLADRLDFAYSSNIDAVPEPATAALWVAGLAMLVLPRRRGLIPPTRIASD